MSANGDPKLSAMEGAGFYNRHSAMQAVGVSRALSLWARFLTRLAWICDDVETMPFFASPEAYKSLTDPTDVDDLGPIVREERNWLIRKVLQKAESDELSREDVKKVEQAMHDLTVIYAGGRSEQFLYIEATATSLQAFSASADAVAPDTFVLVDGDGDNRVFINSSAVAAVEIPWEAHLGYAGERKSGLTPSGSH
jgi:hypothetical protein